MNKLVSLKIEKGDYNMSPSANGLVCGWENFHPPMGMDYCLPSQHGRADLWRVYIPSIIEV